jgi:hypothetical protein
VPGYFLLQPGTRGGGVYVGVTGPDIVNLYYTTELKGDNNIRSPATLGI